MSGEILRLSKGWKIDIIGVVIAIIGFSLLGVSILVEKWGYGYNLLFVLVMGVGVTFQLYGTHVRQSEKRALEPKETSKY